MKQYSLPIACTYNRNIRRVGETTFYPPGSKTYHFIDILDSKYELEPVIEPLDRDAVYDAIYNALWRQETYRDSDKGIVHYAKEAIARLFPQHIDKKL